MKNNIHIKENILGRYISLSFAKSLYSKNAILKVCYEFTDKTYIHINDVDSEYIVNVYPISIGDDNVLYEVFGEFANKLIDQELRQQVISETSSIRNIIIEKAFFDASFKKNDVNMDDASYEDDSCNIIEIRG